MNLENKSAIIVQKELLRKYKVTDRKKYENTDSYDRKSLKIFDTEVGRRQFNGF